MIVKIILNRPLELMKCGEWAGMMIPCPDSSTWDTLSMTISARPSMIWANVSKGLVFSVSPSPLSKDMMLIFPVDFLMMVLITTELGTYSIISTMMCDTDFSSSATSVFSSFFLLSMMGWLIG